MTTTIGQPDTEERRKKVRKYFKITPDAREETRAIRVMWVGVVGLIGAATLLIAQQSLLALLAAGVGAIAALQGRIALSSYRRRYEAAEPKPSDVDMDRILNQDLARVARRAMERLDVTADELELRSYEVDQWAQISGRRRLADQGRGPLVVFGPAERSRGRQGVDRVWRFAVYEVMVICPTGHHLAIYECVLDFVTGRRRNEDTHEYHYPDVVAVTTKTRAPEGFQLILPGGGTSDTAFRHTMTREFQIIVSSGDRSSIIVEIRDDDRPEQEFKLQESGIDRVIAAVRRMLREKKGGVAPTL
ncbi:hypothetical protein FHX44_113952 [Pseudonocardia hierapolitana]|uniref:Uncharacterized protein n=1 Tax=Pseudonocardia hierapolitana TaxID=1128676 RepID=A0A561ST44_9PSEU|nr:hypothetical protein [Pseudonocardia hierapolitana]TWF78033.1 hypothetical protein FHX44_113952 [Pseudonocardia hierapolitana]